MRTSDRRSSIGYHLFPTALGTCGIAWSGSGIRGVQLPESDEAALLRRLRSAHRAAPAEPPPAVTHAVARIQKHLAGELDPLLDVAVDLPGLGSFTRAVYAAARQVRPGATTTYAELAGRAGCPGAARAVGQAMAHNPVPLLVPCHRVLSAGGGLGGFSAHGATRTKLRLLTLEGADLARVAAAGSRSLARADSVLAAIIRRVGPYLLGTQQRVDRFTALAEAIVHQQVSMAAGATIFRRVREATGGDEVLRPEQLLRAAPEALRAAGLSRQKASYLLDLADKCESGALPLPRLDRLDDEEVIRLLTQVRGIGRWSAEMFLMFRLGRLDVLPVSDLGLRKAAQRAYGLRKLPGAAELGRLSAPWIPYRTVATWYLWRSLEAGGL